MLDNSSKILDNSGHIKDKFRHISDNSSHIYHKSSHTWECHLLATNFAPTGHMNLQERAAGKFIGKFSWGGGGFKPIKNVQEALFWP